MAGIQLLEKVADNLAQKALTLVDRTGDEAVVERIAEVIGASSTTLQEAFLTAVRIRRAEARALAAMAEIAGVAKPAAQARTG
jgi:hypothetical protein